MSLNHRRWLLAFLGALGAATLFLTTLAGGQRQQPHGASLVQLIAAPEKYDGKEVSVVGFLVFGIEGDWLFLHREDYDNGIAANAVRVDRTKDMARDLEKLHRNYVHLVGVFRQEPSTSGFAFEGHVVDVQKCELWSQPEHPRAQRFREMQGDPSKKK